MDEWMSYTIRRVAEDVGIIHDVWVNDFLCQRIMRKGKEMEYKGPVLKMAEMCQCHEIINKCSNVSNKPHT